MFDGSLENSHVLMSDSFFSHIQLHMCIHVLSGYFLMKGRLLSYAGKLTLLKACLASIPIYLLSIIKFPR